jgi:hypothetical protein
VWKCIPISCVHIIKHLAAPVLAGLIASNPVPTSCSTACHWAWFPDVPSGVVIPPTTPPMAFPPLGDMGIPDTYTELPSPPMMTLPPPQNFPPSDTCIHRYHHYHGQHPTNIPEPSSFLVFLTAVGSLLLIKHKLVRT